MNELNYEIFQEIQDKIIRELLYSSPSHIDENDPSIIAYDKNMRGLTAKDLIKMDPKS